MSKRRGQRHNPTRRPANVVSMRETPRTTGNVALADSPSFRAAKAEGTLGPNNGNLPHNVQSTSAATNYGAWPAPTPGSGHPYPQMPQVSDSKPLLDQMGATGVAIFSGIITSEEYNPDFYWRDGVKIFDQMLRSDGQIGAMREQMEMPLRHADWNIEPASDDDIDKEIASFVESCLFKEMVYETSEGRTLTQTWDDILRHMELSWWYGFSAFEVCWRIEDGWVKWGRWLPLLPRTVWRWWVGEDNELVGIQQWTFKNYTYQFVEIPADKLLLFVHRQEGNNYEGLSLLRPAYKHWWYKSNFEKIEAIGIERNAVVPAVIYLPENFTSNDLSYAQTVVQNIRANELGGITLPARSTGWDLEYPKNQQRYAMQAQPSIQYHDVMMARSILAQFLNLGSTETGAYALADSQLDAFRASLQGKAKYFEDVINNVAIRRLVDYNYDGVAVYPRIKCSKIALQDLNRLSTLLQALQPYLPPSPELTDWLAKAVGLPVAPGSVIQTTNPTSPSNPDRPQNERANNHETEETDSKDGTDSAETPPSEGSGSAGGGQSGGDAAVSSGGAAHTGLSEVRLMQETLSAIYGLDAIERGTSWKLYGHPPGYSQNRQSNGEWAEGDGGEKASSGGGGSGRGRGGAAKSSAAKSGEVKASGGGSGGGSRRGRNALTYEQYKAARSKLDAELPHLKTGEEREVNHNKAFDLDKQNPGHSLRYMREQKAGEKASGGTGRGRGGARASGAGKSGEAKASARGGSGGGSSSGKTAEQTHAEKVARAEENVRKAQARVDANREDFRQQLRTTRQAGREIDIEANSREGIAATTALRSAQTRLANLKAQGPAERTATSAESIHERSARLQREGGLAREVRPGELGFDKNGTPNFPEARLSPEELISRFGKANTEVRLGQTLPSEVIAAAFGEEHLGSQLSIYPTSQLRAEAKRLGVTPGRTRDETLSRITAHVTGGRYSANFGGGKSSGGGSRSSGGASRSSSGGTPRTAADHEARISALRSQLAQAEADYAAFRSQNGGSLAEHDEHALQLLERIADIESELAYLTEGGDDA